jgi:integrase
MNPRALGPGSLKRDKNGAWVFFWTDALGRRRSRRLSTDKAVAERLRIEILRQRDLEAAGLGGVEGQSRPLAEIAEHYVEDLGPRAVPAHVAQVRARLNRVLRELGGPRVRDVQPYLVARMRARRVAGGASNRTANLEVDTVRACLNWAVRMGLIAANPIASLPGLPARPRCIRRALSDQEITRFLAAAEADDAEQAAHIAGVRSGATKGVQWALRKRQQRIPQAPFWRAFLATGARYGELAAVTWADLDLQRRTLTLRAETTKSRKQRTLPLPQGIVETLADLRAHHERALRRIVGPRDRVFLTPDGAPWPEATTNAMRVFDRLLLRAGIEREDPHGRKIDIHALRGTVASRLARRGVGLVQAQRLLGHSDPKLTAKHYTVLEVEDLRGAVETLNRTEESWASAERQTR